MRKTRCFAVVGALALGGAAQAQTGSNCFPTFLGFNNFGSVGGTVYFDVEIGPNTLTFTDVFLNLNTTAGTPIQIDVYRTNPSGTHVGSELNPAAWTFVASGTGVAAGVDLHTEVTLSSTFDLQSGTKYGIAINVIGGQHAYTNGITGSACNNLWKNADMSLAAGSATNALFGPSVFTPRVFNGTLYYNGGTECGSMSNCPNPPPCTAVEIFSMTVPSSQIEMDSLPVGPVTVNDLNNAGVPGPAALADVLMPDKPTAAAGVYDTNASLGNALARVSGARNIIAPFSSFDATTFEFLLAHDHTEFGFETGDWNGPMIVSLYKGGVLQAMMQTGTTALVPQYVQIQSGCSFDRVTVDTSTTAGNFVITQIWTEEGAAGCYPDCDGSGMLDLFDFLCFVNEFNSGNPYADCDGSGSLDLFDFLCFVNEFNNGCP